LGAGIARDHLAGIGDGLIGQALVVVGNAAAENRVEEIGLSRALVSCPAWITAVHPLIQTSRLALSHCARFASRVCFEAASRAASAKTSPVSIQR
jgi:hypothetical protein